GGDALMLRLDRGNAYNHTLKISILDPSADPRGWSRPRMQQIMRERIHLLPVFRQRYLSTPLGIHQPIWADDPEFDLDSHVRYVACPAPGGMRQFCALVEQVYANPVDRNRPLWQMWVVEGLEGGRVALVTLFHHAYTDGIGAIEMIQNVYSEVPEDVPREPEAWEPAPLPPPLHRMVWALRDLPRQLGQVPTTARALRERVRTEREIAGLRPGLSPSSLDRSAAGPFQCGLSRNRRFACETFSLTELREISAAFGVTINDVFLSSVAGSVRRVLTDAGSAPAAPMVGTMPLSLKPLAERPSPGNYTSIDYVWLHTEIAEPVERLRTSSASAKATKEHFAATKDADISKIVEIMPAALVSALVWANEKTKGRYSPFKNVVVSNVPGPSRPLYLGQWKIDRWFSTGQLAHGAALNFTAWSYGDQFNLCALADAQAVPDAWPFIAGFRASLDELLDTASARPSPHHSTAPATPGT
ncbi:MAG: wax ester/triacylglycerol synthase family O-acyltransferase, partial [Mycolicibacterium sp.]|nr:wax ester/triacylglycerol synthase family O-acyltransferase [Mycolicibacterium sp.]